jgi:3-keto-5-aminohexanoate cleavage enzyme
VTEQSIESPSYENLYDLKEAYPYRPYSPLIINVCPTGMVPMKADNPSVPVAPAEVVDDAARVIEAGASMIHVHAREADGTPTWKPEVFQRIIEGIRAIDPDVVVIATTSGRTFTAFEQRSAVLELDGDAKPDMASLTLGSLNFPQSASVNAPDVVCQLATRMRDRGIKPELEVFELGMLNFAFHLQRRGLLDSCCYVNFLLGSLGTAPARVLDLCNLVREVPKDWVWAGTGIGRFQLPINMAAMIMGGNVRVGLEDNLFFDAGKTRLATNLALVERLVRIAGEMGRTVATPRQARERLGLTRSGS